ncbi:reverse transcriptase domain-containing protein [Tanacetum coccineum]
MVLLANSSTNTRRSTLFMDKTLMAKLGFDRNILSTVLNNTNANGPIAFHITPIGPAHPAEPLGVNGSTGPTVLSDGPKSGFAGSVGAIGSDGTLGSIGSARRELGPHGQTTRQETILPNPLHAMTLQDPATGNWNIDTVGDGHSIPITNSDHSILPTPHRPLHLNNVLITPNIHFLTYRVMLRCDSTGDLYPVTKPSTVPNAFFTSQYTSHQRLRHPGSEVLRRVLSSNSISSIDPNDQEKIIVTCPFGTYAYWRMPFGLCNAPATFLRCMLAIFHDMIEESIEVFMDDFSIFGNSFNTCLNNLDKMLQRCEYTHLVLNWEKRHFMVNEGIELGQKVSSAGLEVDKAKINVISKLLPPTNIKGIRSFLGMFATDLLGSLQSLFP